MNALERYDKNLQRSSFRMLYKIFIATHIFLILINWKYSHSSNQFFHSDIYNCLKDSIPLTQISTEKKRKQQRKEVEEKAHIDSIYFAKVLATAMAYANKNKSKASYHYKFKMSLKDSSSILTDLYFGNLFSQNKKHLLVKRTLSPQIIFNIFLLENSKFKEVCENEQFDLVYLDYTIRDINGDNYKDFLVHWYPSSGCCRRDDYDAYLYLPKTGKFTSNYEFINPTFSPKEKIIRGVEYGHPGEVPLYKYKWNGLKVDTIEFIYPDTSSNTKFYITNQIDRHILPMVKSKIVSNLPKEYQRIKSIDWFLMYQKKDSE